MPKHISFGFPPFSMSLSANLEQRLSVHFGEALQLRVGIVNHAAMEGSTLAAQAITVKFGSAREPWYKLVRFHRVVQGRLKPLQWGLHPLAPQPTAVAVLDDKNSYDFEVGLDPSQLARIHPAIYYLQATINTPLYDSVSSDIVRVQLTLKRKRIKKVQDWAALNALADYWFRRGRYARAKMLAREALKHDPRDLTALILAGDIDSAERKYRAALDEYRLARDILSELHPPRYEPPVHLLRQIQYVESKLGI